MTRQTLVALLMAVIVVGIMPPSVAAQEKAKSSGLEFSFPVQGGKRTDAAVFPAERFGKGRRVVVFSPHIEKTDGNFYNASLHALHYIFGKKRGLFQLKDAKSEYDPSVGGNAIYWKVVNPDQRFYSFPIKDSTTGRIASIVVWLK